MTNSITCTRCRQTIAPMAQAPLPPPEGEELLANTCESCFRDWMGTETMIINEYRLDLSVPRNQELLNLEMAKFLNLPSAGGEASSGLPPQATPKEDPHGHEGHGGSCC